MVILKSRDEIATMRRAGRVVARTLERVVAAVRPGVTLRELDDLAAKTIAGEGATASFLGYHPRFAPSPFPASLCLSVNEVIVHGIPDRTRLRAQGAPVSSAQLASSKERDGSPTAASAASSPWPLEAAAALRHLQVAA